MPNFKSVATGNHEIFRAVRTTPPPPAPHPLPETWSKKQQL